MLTFDAINPGTNQGRGCATVCQSLLLALVCFQWQQYSDKNVMCFKSELQHHDPHQSAAVRGNSIAASLEVAGVVIQSVL